MTDEQYKDIIAQLKSIQLQLALLVGRGPRTSVKLERRNDAEREG